MQHFPHALRFYDMKTIQQLFLLGVCFWLLSGCQRPENPLQALTQGEWTATFRSPMEADNLFSQRRPTLNFDEAGFFDGIAACNQVGGGWTAQDNGRIDLTSIMSTRKGCGKKQNDWEAEYLADLRKVSRYQIRGNRLILRNASRTIRLEYKR